MLRRRRNFEDDEEGGGGRGISCTTDDSKDSLDGGGASPSRNSVIGVNDASSGGGVLLTLSKQQQQQHPSSSSSRFSSSRFQQSLRPYHRKTITVVVFLVGIFFLMVTTYTVLLYVIPSYFGFKYHPRYWFETIGRRPHIIDPNSIRQQLQRQFPIPIVDKDESNSDDDEWEIILHPGFVMADPDHLRVVWADMMTEEEETEHGLSDHLRTMKVPKFWNPNIYQLDGGIRNFLGQHGSYLITKDEAESIGSYYYPPTPPPRSQNHDHDHVKDQDQDQDHPDKKETIFVALASYRDPECLPTVQDLYQRAKYPERIRVGIVDQRVVPDVNINNNNGPGPGGGGGVPPGRRKNNKKDEGLGEEIPADPSCTNPPVPCSQDPNHVLCQYGHLIDSIEVPAALMVGPTFARHLADRLYRGEYFALQVDSHVRFVQDWDVKIIQQWKATNNEMAVLSTYLSDITHSIDSETHTSLRDSTIPIMCRIEYEWKGSPNVHIKNGIQPNYHMKRQHRNNDNSNNNNNNNNNSDTILGNTPPPPTPLLQPFWAAGFSFARGHFVIQVPYDPYLPMVFQGEEISMAIRGFTYGYDFYAPSQHVAFHIYGVRENANARSQVKTFTENEILFAGAKQKAYLRLNSIVGIIKNNGYNNNNNIRGGGSYYFDTMADEYGVGNVRSREKFFQTFGIHTTTREIEPDLCDFVQGIRGQPSSMRDIFTPFLRYDGMGIDYRAMRFNYHKMPDRPEPVIDKEELARLRQLLKQDHAAEP